MYWMASAVVLNNLWADLSPKGNTGSVYQKPLHIACQEAFGYLDVQVPFTTPNMFSPRHGRTGTKYINSRVSTVENTKSARQ